MSWQEGEVCEAQWEDGHYYKAIVEYETDGGYYITYPEYNTSVEVRRDQIRKPGDQPKAPAEALGPSASGMPKAAPDKKMPPSSLKGGPPAIPPKDGGKPPPIPPKEASSPGGSSSSISSRSISSSSSRGVKSPASPIAKVSGVVQADN
jgi:hypothetical protein